MDQEVNVGAILETLQLLDGEGLFCGHGAARRGSVMTAGWRCGINEAFIGRSARLTRESPPAFSLLLFGLFVLCIHLSVDRFQRSDV